MNFDQIIALVNAGYTKAEIEAMTQPATAPAPAQPITAPEPAPDPEPQTVSQPEPQQQPAVSDYDRLEGLLKQFIGIAQANNLNQSMPGAPQQRTATDILSGVITPPERNKR